MTLAKLRRGVRKRKEAREDKERKDWRVPAFSLLPPPPELSEGPEPCTHTWEEPVHVSFFRGDHAVLRICETCRGFVRRCKRCRRFHMVYKGQGGELKEHGCVRRDLGEVPIPFVWMPDANYLPEFDLAT